MNLREAKRTWSLDRWDYNCGGYALETYDWYMPYDNEGESWCFLEDYIEEAGFDAANDMCIEHILADFPELRIVREQAVRDKLVDFNKYQIIAFRLETDGTNDFHFMKLGKNGSWYEKRGASGIIHRHNYEYVFGVWNGRYNGNITFFARERY